jgi:hypothetical protein
MVNTWVPGDLPTPRPWPMRDAIELEAVPGAVPSARMHARVVAGAWRLAGLADDLELIVSELVTNAVRVAADSPMRPPAVCLRLSSDGRSLLVEVWDPSRRAPVRVQPDPFGERGRGLYLVDALSTRWGWFHAPSGGKVVWAELAAAE